MFDDLLEAKILFENVFNNVNYELTNEKGLDSCDVFHAMRHLMNLNQPEEQCLQTIF